MNKSTIEIENKIATTRENLKKSALYYKDFLSSDTQRISQELDSLITEYYRSLKNNTKFTACLHK